MEFDYLSFFYEFTYPILFTFYEEEVIDFEESDFDAPNIEPLIKGQKYLLRCSVKINEKTYTQQDYNKYLTNLSQESLKGIEQAINLVRSRSSFLKQIDNRIQESFNLFIVENIGLIKTINDNFHFNEPPPLGGSELTQDQIVQENFTNLYQPIYNLQFEALKLYNMSFKKIFESEISEKKKQKIYHIEFKYVDLYRNIQTRREVKECIEDFVKMLSQT